MEVDAIRVKDATQLRVLVFSGGRGSASLVRALAVDPRIRLTIAINGYDDGKSTGEVRRFLGDCLGPSDFRKNATTLAIARNSCPAALVELLELRLPKPCSQEDALSALAAVAPGVAAAGIASMRFAALAAQLADDIRRALCEPINAFERELISADIRHEQSEPHAATIEYAHFDFADCAFGNLVFAGLFLLEGRNFNAAINRYSALLGIPEGVITNVTDGANAFLIGLDHCGALLASEADMVNTSRRNRISDIFLLDTPLAASSATEVELCTAICVEEKAVSMNPLLLVCVDQADLIIYAPGTQHSSLFPSYMTPGLGACIAGNAKAAKVLVTNLQEDADIFGASASEIAEKALFYLREKGKVRLPAPRLITDYVINDPSCEQIDMSYIPVGDLESIGDPRRVHVAKFEDGTSGLHDGAKVLAPFIEALVASSGRRVR